jgi:SAM-dependent methyltransferase
MRQVLSEDQISNPPCSICGSNEKIFLHRVSDHEFNTSDDSFDLNKCTNCHAIYLSPRPNERAFKTIYPDNYGNYNTKSDDLSYVKKLSNARQSASIKKLITKLINKSEFSVLDVGCGDGAFLDRIKEAFPASVTFGVEPDPIAAQVGSRSHNVFNGFIENFKSDRQYDLIVSSHVIEHLAEPVAFLKELKAYLKPGGKIIIDTPNTSCIQSKIFGKHWGGIHAPRHWTLFDNEVIRYATNEAQLNVVSVTHLPLNVFWIWSVHSLLYSYSYTRNFSEKYFNTKDVLSRKSIYYLCLMIIAEILEQISGLYPYGQGQIRVIMDNTAISAEAT